MDGLVVLLNEAGVSLATLKQHIHEQAEHIRALEERLAHHDKAAEADVPAPVEVPVEVPAPVESK